jgi:hypothetical protein
MNAVPPRDHWRTDDLFAPTSATSIPPPIGCFWSDGFQWIGGCPRVVPPLAWFGTTSRPHPCLGRHRPGGSSARSGALLGLRPGRRRRAHHRRRARCCGARWHPPHRRADRDPLPSRVAIFLAFPQRTGAFAPARSSCADHMLRGELWPQSVWRAGGEQLARAGAAWVGFLVVACLRSVAEMRRAERTATLEQEVRTRQQRKPTRVTWAPTTASSTSRSTA